MTTRRSLFASVKIGAACLAGLLAYGCSDGGGSGSTGAASASGSIDLVEVASGRLVDVWAALEKGGLTLIQKDVVIGTDILDDARAGKPPIDVVYTFETADASTGQETLLIHIDPKKDAAGRPMNPRFLSAFDRLDDNLQPLGTGYYGQDQAKKPFAVAPRNGAIRLRFSKDLGLDQTYFTLHRDDDPTSPPVGLKNTRSVQLLEIRDDPTVPGAENVFKIIPVRISYQGSALVLDPVILGEEGPDLGIPNNPEGLPASLGTSGANIRVALPLEGAIRIRGLRERSPLLQGIDAYGMPSITRDFRSGHHSDQGASLANGFLNDPIPPRIVGEQLISLLGLEERVAAGGEKEYFLLLYQEAMKHTQKYIAVGDEGLYSPVEINPLDRIKLVVLSKMEASAMLVEEPEKIVFRDGQGQPELDNYGNPKVHYRVKTDLSEAGFETFKKHMNRDPGTGGYLPTDVIQVTNFQAQVIKETAEGTRMPLAKDDPRYFLTFSPPAPDPRYPTDNISPFASVLTRFTKPVDIRTMRAFDTLILSVDADVNKVLDAQAGTAGLIVSRIFDEDGAQRVIRSQPPLGFYHSALNAGSQPKQGWDPALFRQSGGTQGNPDPTDLFYLYMIAGREGVKDLAGNPVDLQGATQEFFQVDFTLRADAPTNRVANIARRFMNDDEDPNPGVKDIFGAFIHLPGGYLMGRPSARFTSHVDNLNPMPDPLGTDYKFCPGTEVMYTAGLLALGQPLQNPLNPMGCRLQTIWRENDLSLSRLDPYDYNLDVEQMWWAPFRLLPVSYDIFDRMSLYVHHSERRPSNCMGGWAGGSGTFPNSGLATNFRSNYLDSSDPVRAFESEKLVIQASDVAYEPNNINVFMPLPRFQKPYLVFRDERDLRLGGGATEPVLSPFLTKGVSTVKLPNFGGTAVNSLPTIALPLLADFFIYPDDPQVNGASNGYNGWQVAIGVDRQPTPNFRVYSGGGYKPPGVPRPPASPGGPPDKVDPSTQSTAQGGYTPLGARTPAGDNTIYWIRVDFAKRLSVVTNGFVQIHSPNKGRNSAAFTDPRLGNFPAAARPSVFDLVFEPPLPTLPQGTRVIPAFRGAYAEGSGNYSNGMLDARAAGEVHAFTASSAYFQSPSEYFESPNDLLDPAKLRSVAGTALDPNQVRYFNWRLVFQNNVDVDPPVTPVIDSLGIIYRFDR